MPLVPYISHTCLCVGDKPHQIDPEDAADALGNDTIYEDHLWNNGEKIGYAFFGVRKGTPRQKQAVRDAIAEWTKYANVTFIEYADQDDSSVRVRISFEVVVDETKRASWAFMGEEAAMEASSVEPNVNIAWVDGGTEEELSEARAVILHQIGHLLGMVHEFGRDVTLNREYMEQSLARKPNRWRKDDVDQALFQVIQQGNITNFPVIEETSIMKYYMPAAQNEQNVAIPPTLEISEKDKAYMRVNYPYLAGKNFGKLNFENSMAALNLDAATVANMIKNLKKGDLAGVRLDYVKYLKQVHGAPVVG